MTDDIGRQSTPGSPPNRFLEWLKQRWVAILLIVLAVVFIIQNGIAWQTTTMSLLWITVTVPLWLVALIVFAAGCAVGYVFAKRRAARREQR
ncbi:LapA family protein [Agromyces archimandritae]|uniref:DUF1049 domain-containing protein n=1 Tax=Agromyces archimandritae TaxID=2781962 RepID=A0A975IPF7_9MICO|nr:LapA family protein [Agromyces archimandritae]QTX05588.1 DUF1049 domain-containing protein [Agromyces archimandritae]